MGGGGQANKSQASGAYNSQQAASQQDMALSASNAARQKQLTDTLFGSGAPGSSGTLSGMLDPKSLNTGAPTGAYKTAWNDAQNQIGQNFANERGSLARSFANSGATSNSTPNGFQADQMNKLSRGEADTRGSTYTGIVGQQHGDALSNFWNANNLASGQAASSGQGALTGAGNSGSSSASLYGTAGQYHPSQWGSVLGSALQAGGSVGAAAMTGGGSSAAQQCPATGSLVLMADETWKKVEELRKGDRVLAIDGSIDILTEDPLPSTPQDVLVISAGKFTTHVSRSHWFDRAVCGYSLAFESLGEHLKTLKSVSRVTRVACAPKKLVCWDLTLSPSHSYCVDGYWSLG